MAQTEINAINSMLTIREYTLYQYAIVELEDTGNYKSMVVNDPPTTDANLMLTYIREYLINDAEFSNINVDDVNNEWLQNIKDEFVLEGSFIALAWVKVNILGGI